MAKDTVVIYVHGIGTRQRDEEISAILDAIDLSSQEADRSSVGKARRFVYSRERSEEFDEDVRTISFSRIVNIAGKDRPTSKIKIYECFWTHKAVNSSSIFSILWWIFLQIGSPLRPIVSAWRDYQLYRSKELVKSTSEIDKTAYEQLRRAYKEFDQWDNRSKYPQGSFKDFTRFLREKFPQQRADILCSLAQRWRSTVFKSSIASFFSFFFILSSANSYLCTALILFGYSVVGIKEWLNSGAQFPLSLLAPALVGAAMCLAGPLIASFLKSHIADVMYWTQANEKSKKYDVKRNIQSHVRLFFLHALRQNPDSNLVVVSHSLGSVIAFDAITEIGDMLESRGKDDPDYATLQRIFNLKCLITYGSPIDLIFDTFQTSTESSRRYGRIAAERRKSLRLSPFVSASRGGDARIFNFWTRYDPISSPLFSPCHSRDDLDRVLFNIEVPSAHPSLPHLSHTQYLRSTDFSNFLYRTIVTGNPPKNIPDDYRPDYTDRMLTILGQLSTTLFILIPFFLLEALYSSQYTWLLRLLATLASCTLLVALISYSRRKRLRTRFRSRSA